LQLPSAKGGEVVQQVTASRGGANRHADSCASLAGDKGPGRRGTELEVWNWKTRGGDEDDSAGLSSQQDAEKLL